MSDEFKIFVHRLKNGQKEIIKENLSPDFLGIHEAELGFEVPVRISGEAELANDTLILRLSAVTEVSMPCAICNQSIQVPVSVEDFCHTIGVAEIKGDVYNFKEILREEILLALPQRVECNQGNCPERKTIAKYFSRS